MAARQHLHLLSDGANERHLYDLNCSINSLLQASSVDSASTTTPKHCCLAKASGGTIDLSPRILEGELAKDVILAQNLIGIATARARQASKRVDGYLCDAREFLQELVGVILNSLQSGSAGTLNVH
jgi:hypothetical protein